MNLRMLLSRLNPASYERVKCGPCNGTGFELVDGKPRYHHGSPVHCQMCHGRGWHAVKRESSR